MRNKGKLRALKTLSKKSLGCKVYGGALDSLKDTPSSERHNHCRIYLVRHMRCYMYQDLMFPNKIILGIFAKVKIWFLIVMFEYHISSVCPQQLGALENNWRYLLAESFTKFDKRSLTGQILFMSGSKAVVNKVKLCKEQTGPLF